LKAAMMGAEEFGVAMGWLVAMGCVTVGDVDDIGPEPLDWFTRRAASARVRRGLAFPPEFVSAPVAGFR
jgi:hypothetical protein